ncbi:hypothetical protein [Streptomyces sp. NBC_00158]|uniref:hypothetical protein n=1 Tax=Streptomyces sp. NBC_00158 TaxID=2903627 RepID=UPI003249F3DA
MAPLVDPSGHAQDQRTRRRIYFPQVDEDLSRHAPIVPPRYDNRPRGLILDDTAGGRRR